MQQQYKPLVVHFKSKFDHAGHLFGHKKACLCIVAELKTVTTLRFWTSLGKWCKWIRVRCISQRMGGRKLRFVRALSDDMYNVVWKTKRRWFDKGRNHMWKHLKSQGHRKNSFGMFRVSSIYIKKRNTWVKFSKRWTYDAVFMMSFDVFF